MSMFTTRVELHNATWEDYETLHTAMESAGFSRTITSDDGITYQLPTAEYNVVGNYTIQQVFDAAWTAAGSVGKKYAVLVSEAAKRRWNGLSVVTSPKAYSYR
jgi:hypothetical protein